MRRFLLVIPLLGVLAVGILQQPLTASASPLVAQDLTCNVYSGPGTCGQMPDWGGDSFWCNNFSASSTHNGYMQRCLRSLKISGTGDNLRYVLFGQQIVQNPDPNNAVYNFVQTSADTSQSGNNSTMETRLWSTARASCSGGSLCDQENYSGLEPGNTCDANGGSLTIGANVGVGDLGVNYTDNNPLFYGCVTVPASDIYSQYYDYTLMQYSWDATKLTETFVFSQIMPNGWNGASVHIGLSAKVLYFLNGGLGGEFTVGSGNWTDNYNY